MLQNDEDLFSCLEETHYISKPLIYTIQLVYVLRIWGCSNIVVPTQQSRGLISIVVAPHSTPYPLTLLPFQYLKYTANLQASLDLGLFLAYKETLKDLLYTEQA